MDSILFLDFDGVIRLARDGAWSGDSSFFCGQRIRLLNNIIEDIKTRIVISSDHRELGLSYCQNNLGSKLSRKIHPDWKISHNGMRWQQIEEWILAHPDVEKFCVLDDNESLFFGAPKYIIDRLVLCNNRHGLVEGLTGKINLNLQA